MNAINIVPQYSNYFNLDNGLFALNASIINLGCVIGATFAGTLCDRLGRKKAMGIGGCITIVGCVLQAASVHEAMFAIARIIVGIGMVQAATAGPIYVTELAAPFFDLPWFSIDMLPMFLRAEFRI